jgi:divalent metal cation (Fe/Co/Zn/Cd) transporter
MKKARRLEIITVIYICTSATFLGLTMGSSQVMRTSFFEDVLSIIPAITFLVCARMARWPASKKHPYGFHGVVSIGYLTASLALLGMGTFLLIEALTKLAAQERTTIGGVEIFGRTIWSGWLMLCAVVYTAVPSVFLGRAKLKLAPKIHDKVLFADAQMMKADWMAETATATGVLGVGLGFWWVDPIAASLVSMSILHDGWANLRSAVGDLIERRPMKTDRSGPEALPDELREAMRRLDWVEDAAVRLREVGHVFYGEVFIQPRGSVHDLPRRIGEAADTARGLNWRIRDVTVMVVPELDSAGDLPR